MRCSMKNENEVILNFGKYIGKSVAEIFSTDNEYLVWVAKNMQPKNACIKFIKEFMQPHIEKNDVLKEELKRRRQPHMKDIISIARGVVMKKTLKTGISSAWSLSIISSLEQGDVLTPRAREILIHMCGKSYGRRNSKKYNEITSKLIKAFEDVLLIK